MEISEDKTKLQRSPDKPLPEVTGGYKHHVKQICLRKKKKKTSV